ncbi:MAG: DUF262 domain-containing protein, partial [Candidatus Bathyarchaeota archaeon]|nr:DUF262 domain-containing protein [Candidatus Bathyarchaeota archaeon]
MSVDKLFDFGTSFEVPLYQRNFSWQVKDQITAFWEDLSIAYRRDSEHFMGAMYFVPKENDTTCYWILDGQQRFATFLLLLAALRQRFNDTNHPDCRDHEKTISSCIYKTPRGEKSRIPLLILNSRDRKFFEDLVVVEGAVAPVPRTPSEYLIKQGYDFFLSVLTQGIKTDAGMEEIDLVKMYKTLIRKFTLLVVTIES